MSPPHPPTFRTEVLRPRRARGEDPADARARIRSARRRARRSRPARRSAALVLRATGALRAGRGGRAHRGGRGGRAHPADGRRRRRRLRWTGRAVDADRSTGRPHRPFAARLLRPGRRAPLGAGRGRAARAAHARLRRASGRGEEVPAARGQGLGASHHAARRASVRDGRGRAGRILRGRTPPGGDPSFRPARRARFRGARARPRRRALRSHPAPAGAGVHRGAPRRAAAPATGGRRSPRRAPPLVPPMIRRARSLADLLLAALCLWAAWYHTPPGALLRTAFARLLGDRSATPGLLSYYGAGALPLQLAEPLPPRAALSPGAALGLGAQSALERASPADRAQVLARAGLRSGSADALGDWIGREAQRQGSREAAVLSLFCGEEAARFARERAGGTRGAATLEELARQLPPRYADRVGLAATALTLGTAYALAWPLPDSAQVTSLFGVRAHPLLGGRRFHSGIDLGVPVGTPVRAAAEGVVRRASDDRVSGRLVLLDHGSGVSTVYC